MLEVDGSSIGLALSQEQGAATYKLLDLWGLARFCGKTVCQDISA